MTTVKPRVYIHTLKLQEQLEKLVAILDEAEFFGDTMGTLEEFLEALIDEVLDPDFGTTYLFKGRENTVVVIIEMKNVSSDGNAVIMHPEIVDAYVHNGLDETESAKEVTVLDFNSIMH